MNIVSLRCPHCGAELPLFSRSSNVVKCSYCCSTIVLSDLNVINEIPVEEGTYNKDDYSGFKIVNGELIEVLTESDNLIFPESVLSIKTENGKSRVFRNRKIRSIDMSKSRIYRIPDYLFYMCNTLETIILPEHLAEIGESSFYHCTSLRKIKIPLSVKHIGNEAFAGCRNLNEVIINNRDFNQNSRSGMVLLGTIFEGSHALNTITNGIDGSNEKWKDSAPWYKYTVESFLTNERLKRAMKKRK